MESKDLLVLLKLWAIIVLVVGLSPPVKYFTEAVLLLWIIFVLCLVFLMLLCLFIAALWSPDLFALVGDDYCILLLPHVVSLVRCGT